MIEGIFSIFLFCIFLLSAKKQDKIKNYFLINHPNNIQDISNLGTPRFGGIILFLVTILYLYFIDSTYINNILLFVPALLISFYEDLYQNVNIYFRLILILFTAFLLVNFNFVIDINFFILITVVLFVGFFINANNVIDGLNGLLSFYFLIFTGRLFLEYNPYYDEDFYKFFSSILVYILIFTYFNFPKSKLFYGDCGSYFIGFLSLIIINYHYQSNLISVSEAIFTMIYPALELGFSIVRRYFSKSSIFQSDLLHLHSLIYLSLNGILKNKIKANYYSSTILLISFVILNIIANCLQSFASGISIFFISYFISYFFLLKHCNKNEYL